MERSIFASSDYGPQLLSETWEKESWKLALLGDQAFFLCVLHLEDSEWNVDDFWLLPASLQGADLQDRRQQTRRQLSSLQNAQDSFLLLLSSGQYVLSICLLSS